VVEPIVKLLSEIAYHSFLLTLAVVAALAVIAVVTTWRG
jgi:hypothetical protein